MAKCDLSQKSKDGLKSEKQLIYHINRIKNENQGHFSGYRKKPFDKI